VTSRPSFARPGTQKALSVTDAKALVLEKIQDGLKVAEACSLAQRSEETYRDWMKKDAEFKAAVQSIRAGQAETRETGRPVLPDFDVFCRDYLRQPLNIHQLRMWDVIEGRPPRDLHPSMDYLPGYMDRVLINVPPEHAKSTTFTVNYSVYRIHKNSDIRIVIMSQGQTLAARFLGEIKFKLTSPLYREMHMRFAPEGGWKDPDQSWTNDAIYVKGKGGDKDPTVQALGLKGQIYGTRSDLIFLDDVVTTKNAREIDTQTTLLDREIESRLPSEQEGGGLLAILGTRVAPQDLYRHLIDVADADDERVWTYFRQPAVLDYGNGDSSDWTTLWPEKWNGRSLARRKRSNSWNLIYQQMNVDDEMTFSAQAVEASINAARFPGLMTAAGMGHREGGMDGLYKVGGLDPAASGNTAIIIQALDRETEKRYVLDGWNRPNAGAGDIIDKIKYFTDLYGLHEWVIEAVALQRFITTLPELVNFLRTRGCKLTPHMTTANKFDADWGVQTMGPLFDTCGVVDEKNPSGKWRRTPKTALMELPSPRQNAWVNDFIQQLTTWQPSGMGQKVKTDLVMAFWFGSIAFSKILNRSKKRQTHLSTPFTSPQARSRQQVISISALRRQKQQEQDERQGVG
jgi:hypothetical protein